MNSSMDIPSAEACYKVDGIISHEGFVYEQDRSDIPNDVVLVHLARPVIVTREISPICLPKPGAVMAAGTPCFVTGWGYEKGRNGHKCLNHSAFASLFKVCSVVYSLWISSYLLWPFACLSQFIIMFVLTSILGKPKVTEKLNQAALPIVDFQACSKPANRSDTLRPSMICAGYESPDELKSACQVRRNIQLCKKSEKT